MAKLDIPQKFADSYTKGNYMFPTDEIDPDKKGREWFIACHEGMFRWYLNDQTGILYSRRADYVTARLYAEAMQPTQKYLDRLQPKEPDGTRKGWANLSYDPLPVMPKMVNIAVAKLAQADHDVTCTATDDNARTEKVNKKYELLAKAQLSAKMAELGINVSQDDIPVLPNSLSQIEMFMDLSYKLKKEIVIENWLKRGFFQYSNWKDIEKDVIKDGVVVGTMAVKEYKEGDKICGRYVDPANLIISYSRYRTFDNADKVAELVPYRISQLRHLLMKEGYSEEEIGKLAKNYEGLLGNAQTVDLNVYYYNLTPYYRYDDFKILVMDAEWNSDDVYYSETKVTRKGDKISFDRPYGYKKEGKSVERTCLNVVYQSKWVVGTKMVFQYGKAETARESSGKDKYLDVPKKSFKVIKVDDNSLVMRCIPIIDAIQLDFIKLQNAKAMAKPAGLAYDISVFEEVKVGDNKITIPEIFKITRDTGDIIFRSTGHHGQPLSAKPFIETEGGIGRQLNEYITAIDYNIKFIGDFMGINPIVDGTNDNPRQAVGVSEMLQSATNNALQPIYWGYVYLKENIATDAVNKLLQSEDLSSYYDILGDYGTDMIELMKELKGTQCSIHLELLPDDQQKQFIRDFALQANKIPLEQGGISAGDFIKINRLINEGRLKLAEAWLMYITDQNKKQAQQMQMQNIQAQQQASQQTETAKIQAQIEVDKNKLQGEAQIEQIKGQNAINLAMVTHKNNMEEIDREQSHIAGAKVYSADKSVETARIKQQTDVSKEVLKQEHESVTQDKDQRHEISEAEKEREHSKELERMKPKKVAA